MTGQQLKNSILQMAVQGKLVPQDPNDEPASVLLERIRTEKEQLIKEGKIKKEKRPSIIFRGADNLPYEKVGKNEPLCIADEVPFEIPESWEWARLGMISTYSYTKKKINAQNADPKMWGLDLEDIEKGGKLLEQKTVGERKAIGDKTIFDSGDILYSKLRPYLLKILVAPDCGICTPEIVPFKVFGNIVPDYIVAFLKCPYVDAVINSVTYGVKMPRVGTKTMTELLVPIPPLSEQKRIVEKLNEVTPITDIYAEAYIRATKLNQEFPELLKKSILQEAVQGKLVPQDLADEPASVLLERIRAEKQKLIAEGKIKKDKHESVIFRRDNSHYEKRDSEEVCIDDELPYEIPKTWCWARMGSCLDVRDGTHDTPKYVTEGIPLVTSKNLCNGKIDFSTAKFISKEDHLAISQRSKVDSEDIMYAMIGSIGNPVLYNGNAAFSIKNMALFKKINNGLDMEYVYWFLYLSQDTMKKFSSGGVQSFVSLGYLRNYWIPVPPIEEQHRIVTTIKQILPKLSTL
ncbi:restriction endonuclease subunit S [Anaerobutyricum soehngenii]|uniref:restriction endonuclease subunit S n=1 Tax=Anaerobutyricum soehngenii TaxID=105843 RepID=UPI003D7B2356